MCLSAAAAILLLASSVEVDGAAVLRSEASAGVVPIAVDTSLSSLDLSLHPGLEGSLRFGDGRLALSYGADLVRKVPRRSAPERPIIFQTLQLDYAHAVSRRTAIFVSIGAGFGELAYDNAALLSSSTANSTGAETGSNPTSGSGSGTTGSGSTGSTSGGTGSSASGSSGSSGSSGASGTSGTSGSGASSGASSVPGVVLLVPVIEALRSDALFQWSHRVDRTNRVYGGLTLAITRPKGSQSVFPETDSAEATFGWGHEWTRTDGISFDAALAFHQARESIVTESGVAPGDSVRFGTASAYAAWRHRLSSTTFIDTSAGLTVLTSSQGASLSPFVQVGASAGLWRSGEHAIDARTSLALDTFFDPILGVVERRASARASMSYRFGTDLSVALSSSFATPLEGSNRSDDRTYLSVDLPITYRLSDVFSLEAGGRLAARAPHLAYRPFEFRQLLAEVYTSLTMRWASDGARSPYGAP